MTPYNLYAGIIKPYQGIFDVSCYGTWYCDNFGKAMTIAHDIAIDVYQSYEGQHGIMSWQDCLKKLFTNKGPTPSKIKKIVDEYYNREVNTWIFYYAYYKY